MPYMVMVKGKGQPRVEHDTYEDAAREAERLAKQEKQKTYMLRVMAEFTPETRIIFKAR